MAYKFFICDVFTRRRFGGNQLAVLPDAAGLSSEQMQQIAREFNYSETTFVLPPEQGHTRKVRIFTPTREVAFAGHPNIGTAFTLAATGEFGPIEAKRTVVFEEKAGLVSVDIEPVDSRSFWCELTAPQQLKLGSEVSVSQAAEALSLNKEDIVTDTHPPIVAGVGLPFLVVEVADRETLARSRFNLPSLEMFEQRGISPDILLYTQAPGNPDIHARMFAPLDGVPEDPATGSANCALVALLTQCAEETDGEFRWRISQGEDMGRPSLLDARTVKRNGEVAATMIGGDCVLVSEGVLHTD